MHTSNNSRQNVHDDSSVYAISVDYTNQHLMLRLINDIVLFMFKPVSDNAKEMHYRYCVGHVRCCPHMVGSAAFARTVAMQMMLRADAVCSLTKTRLKIYLRGKTTKPQCPVQRGCQPNT